MAIEKVNEFGGKIFAKFIGKDSPMTTVEAKRRNYSFLDRNPEGLDEATGWDNREFVIPATPGTWYWAILKYCYQNHDKPMNLADIVEGAIEIYSGRDPDKFEQYKAKTTVKTRRNGVAAIRTTSHWRDRIETNIKTLTRHGGNNPYGQRLRERGHILRWEASKKTVNGNNGSKNCADGVYILRTDTDQPLRRTKE